MGLPGYDDVVAAHQRIRQQIVQTPLLRSDELDKRAGATVLIKPECLQTTGSFKLRGATNRLLLMPDADRAAGVVAFSSGNHAQGVARAAARLRMPALIVMPFDAPAIKVAGVQNDGAEIRFYDRETESREQIAADVAAERGAVLVPSYDDPDIIAGQGTAFLELTEQTAPFGGLAHYISCAGGGGLLAGAALAAEGASPNTRLWSAEPDGFDDHKRSFESGTRQTVISGAQSICDAILTPTPGEITFAINGPRVAGGFSVSEAEVMAAVAFAFQHLKLVVEPGGAVALAVALRGLPTDMQGQRVGIILSGGNVDPAVFCRCLGVPALQ